MRHLPGYEIQETLHETLLTIVVRAIRLADNKAVIIKTLRGEPPPPSEVARLKREYEIAKKVASPGIIEVYHLESYGPGQVAIIMEPFAESVDRFLAREKRISLARFFAIAPKLAQILGQLHHQNVIHKDINPKNILLDSQSNALKIIDFGISSELPRERQNVTGSERLEGSLPYISPEQTGRIHAGLDYRTDYYSLGATFFEMLTGTAPFQANDMMGWVYCHISQDPPRPSGLNPEIPAAIEAIVLKLLAKNAEDRYQSSYGLVQDLEVCHQAWLKNGKIDDFQPGQWDISERLHIPQKLYGREKEVETLLTTFDSVAAGNTELLLVSGYAGVGKSALVHEVHRPIAGQRGYFIEGKFDQLQRNIPFSALAQAFRGLVRQLLTEPGDKLALWQAKLRQSFGPNGQIVLDMIPELAAIVGPQPPVQALGLVESQNRFNAVFHDFVKLFAAAEHPLVIFLDDLQWSDIPTLNLLQHWLKSADLSHLLILAAYRDNQVDAAHPLTLALEAISKFKAFQTVRLAPLTEVSINQLVAETLWTAPEESAPLAQLLHHKTEGNPFFVEELLKDLYHKQTIWFDPGEGRWAWDMPAIRRAEITSNIVEFLLDALHTFPAETQHALRLAACIGNRFDLRTLSIICEQSPEQTNADLFAALQAGLIFPLSEAYKFVTEGADRQSPAANPEYIFQHDRVQQAAYALIDDASKPAVHLAIGRLMLAHLTEAEQAARLVDIVRQLNEGRTLITDQAERETLARLNLQAGIKAKEATACQPALAYLKAAQSLLGENPWQNQYDLILAISLEYCQCAYLTGEIDAAENLVDVLHQQVRTTAEQVEIYYLQQRHYLVLSKTEEAIQAGFASLSLLGIKMPYKPNPAAIFKEFLLVKRNLRKKAVPGLIDFPEMTDGDKRLAIRAMSEMAPAIYNTGNENLILLLSFKMLNLSLRFGNSTYSSYAYFVYGNFLTNYMGNPKVGYQFGQLAVALNEKYRDKSLECRTRYTYNFFIRPWNEHWNNLTPGFQQTVESGYQSGDLFFLAYASLLTYAWNPQLPLEEKVAHLAQSKRICQSTGFEVAIDASALTHQTYLNYQGGTHERFSLNTDSFDEAECLAGIEQRNDISGITYYHYFKADIFFMYENYAEALTHITAAMQYEATIKGTPTEARICLITFFACAALYNNAPPGEKRTLKKRLQKRHKQMKAWANHCPANFLHLRLAMEAELARLAGKPQPAARLYADAVSQAKAGGWHQDAGMILMLACNFYLDRGLKTEASAYLRDAHGVYQAWGAHGKLAFLQETYTDLLPEKEAHPSALQTIYIENALHYLDLETIFKAAQTLSQEVVLEELLQKLMTIVCENAGAETGYLLLPASAGWHIAVACTAAAQTDVLLEQIPLSDGAPVAQSIVTYVIRTQGNIVLHDAAQSGQFMQDAHIRAHQTKSVCCLPLRHQGKTTAILYLENNLIPGAFTPERLEILKLLGSQAAISLENAALYANLEEKVRERTTELSTANRHLQAEIEERHRTEMMAQQAKDEAERANQAKSRFLANMSHELRTPLNGIMGYAQILDWEENLSSEQRHGLAVIRRSGDHLLTLINDVLDLAKIEADEVVLAPVDFSLSNLITDLVELFKPRARGKGLHFLLETRRLGADGQPRPEVDLPAVYGDSKRLRQVLINLLGNAVKFTETGGVTLRLTVLDDSNQPDNKQITIRFEVIDTGAGISAGEQQQVFEPFKQAGDLRTHAGGTGLGLSISHNLVKLMGGELQVKSEVGQGSTFWFALTLPLAETAEPESAVSPARIVGVTGTPPIILVVDDNADNRAVLQEMLQRAGCIVHTAPDGVAGLEQAAQLRPNCVITDLVMPDMSGFEFIRRVRQDEQFADTVIIASSASVFETDQADSLTAGSNAFLPKPVRSETLYNLLAEFLQVQWQLEQAAAQPAATARLLFPPKDTVERIRETASMGDIAALQAILEELANLPVQYQPFTVRLKKLVSEFRLNEILDWLAKEQTNF